MMGYIHRPRKRAMAEINVVPYIDVMMVLLVIFIATAPVIMQGVSVDLPQAESTEVSEDLSDPIIVYVDKEGQYAVQSGSTTSKLENLQEVTDLFEEYKQKSPKSPVLVSGDRNAKYDLVVQAMVALKNAGEKSVGLVTEPLPSNK